MLHCACLRKPKTNDSNLKSKINKMQSSFNCYLKKLKLFLLSLCVVFVCTNLIYSYGPDWFLKLKNLKILESSKVDVEKVFDYSEIIDSSNLAKKEKNGWGEKIEYKTKDGYLEVLYSTGKCATSKSNFGYNVESGTVVELNFYPFVEPKYSELKFDQKQFESEYVLDVNNTYILKNKKLGISITVNNAKVSSINFTPSILQKTYECETVRK